MCGGCQWRGSMAQITTHLKHAHAHAHGCARQQPDRQSHAHTHTYTHTCTQPHLGEREVALIGEGRVHQLGRVALVLPRVLEGGLRHAHLHASLACEAVRACVCAWGCVHVCVRVHACERVCACVSKCKCVHVCVVRVCLYVCVYVCMHVDTQAPWASPSIPYHGPTARRCPMQWPMRRVGQISVLLIYFKGKYAIHTDIFKSLISELGLPHPTNTPALLGSQAYFLPIRKPIWGCSCRWAVRMRWGGVQRRVHWPGVRQ